MSKGNEQVTPIVVDGMVNHGLTKRELFAAMTMQGLCVPCIPGRHNSNDEIESQDKAKMAVRLADALLKALSQESGGE